MAVNAQAADTPSTHALMEVAVLKSKFKTKIFNQIFNWMLLSLSI